MTDRVASDTLTTYRAAVVRSGGTRRPCLRLPDQVDAAAGEVIRLALSGDQHHAKVEADGSGPLVRGAYVNRRLARADGEGENRLADWFADVGREPGESVDLDVVTPGYLYGLRAPGERVVYEVTDQPDSSLSDIARRLDG